MNLELKKKSGVKGFIKDQLPIEWDYALRQHRCLTSFVTQFYDNISDAKHRNKYYYKITMRRVLHDFRTKSLIEITKIYQFKEGVQFWQKVQNSIYEYQIKFK